MVKERLRSSGGGPVQAVEGRRALSGALVREERLRRTIAREAAARGLSLGPIRCWQQMSGGRANRVWRTKAAGRELIVKQVREHRTSSLFPNHAAGEAAVLAHLGPTGLAPELLAHWRGEAGPVLVMAAVQGTVLSRGGEAVEAVAATLLGLWRMQPLPGLRRRAGGSRTILNEAHAFLEAWARAAPEEAAERAALERLAPTGELPPSSRTAFLHGDPVPANMIAEADGNVTLVDWQCAAAGDPVEDMALFLSPAMQQLYGDGPLSDAAAERFLAALPEDLVGRYARAAPFHAFRLAAYCGWRAALGDTDYREGLRLEMVRLAALRRQG